MSIKAAVALLDTYRLWFIEGRIGSRIEQPFGLQCIDRARSSHPRLSALSWLHRWISTKPVVSDRPSP
jgi:hypothetical protein